MKFKGLFLAVIFGMTASFQWAHASGFRVGNGGDSYVLEFVSVGTQIHDWLAQDKRGLVGENDSTRFLDALRSATILSTDEELVLNGVPKDAINIPQENKIILNRSRWSSAGTDFRKYGIVSHEVFGLIGVKDSDYALSMQIAQAMSSIARGRSGHHKKIDASSRADGVLRGNTIYSLDLAEWSVDRVEGQLELNPMNSDAVNVDAEALAFTNDRLSVFDSSLRKIIASKLTRLKISHQYAYEEIVRELKDVKFAFSSTALKFSEDSSSVVGENERLVEVIHFENSDTGDRLVVNRRGFEMTAANNRPALVFQSMLYATFVDATSDAEWLRTLSRQSSAFLFNPEHRQDNLEDRLEFGVAYGAYDESASDAYRTAVLAAANRTVSSLWNLPQIPLTAQDIRKEELFTGITDLNLDYFPIRFFPAMGGTIALRTRYFNGETSKTIIGRKPGSWPDLMDMQGLTRSDPQLYVSYHFEGGEIRFNDADTESVFKKIRTPDGGALYIERITLRNTQDDQPLYLIYL